MDLPSFLGLREKDMKLLINPKLVIILLDQLKKVRKIK